MAEVMSYSLVICLFLLIHGMAGELDMGKYIQRYCERNEDCVHHLLCCSITPALGKRQTHHGNIDKDFNVHYCLPYKNENATWCELRLQYSQDTPNYHGLCPCGPGLTCSPTTELDPKYYPVNRFGKCTPNVI